LKKVFEKTRKIFEKSRKKSRKNSRKNSRKKSKKLSKKVEQILEKTIVNYIFEKKRRKIRDEPEQIEHFRTTHRSLARG